MRRTFSLVAPFASSLLAAFSLAAIALGGCAKSHPTVGNSGSTGAGGNGAGSGVGGDPSAFAIPPLSCSYTCPSAPCAENTQPYVCPNLGAWSAIPHADSCGAWDGSYPAVTPGKCTVSAPVGDAIKYAGADPDDPSALIMPGGRRLTPAGADWVFKDGSSQVNNMIPVPGTSFVLTVDVGYLDHILRVVDPAKIGSGDPTVSQVNFANPITLNQGIAFSAPDRAFVPRSDGLIQYLKLDTATGALTREDACSVTLPAAKGGGSYYVSAVAVSADNKRLFVTSVNDTRMLVVDVSKECVPASSSSGGAGGSGAGGSAGTGTGGSGGGSSSSFVNPFDVVGTLNLGTNEMYGVYVDPNDAATQFAYVTMWEARAVKQIDVSNPKAPKLTRSFPVEKDPQGLAFLDSRWMVVGNDLGDSLSVLDRVMGTVSTFPVDTGLPFHGIEPSSLWYDAPRKRLWSTQAGIDAVAAYDVSIPSDGTPTIALAGRLPTQWWPSAVWVEPSGDVVVTSLMGRGTGPAAADANYNPLKGGIQRAQAPSAADLDAGQAKVTANRRVTDRPGYPAITCPPGVDDFPIPATNTGNRSPKIEHVFVIVRENKSYDGVFGDMPGGKGNAAGTIVPSAQMDGIWTNLRRLAKTFTFGDNFHTAAFISNQGHLWTTHGRTDDFNEREWPVTGYGRGTRPDGQSGGVTDVARPAEGSMFDWLGANDVPCNVLGEIVGLPSTFAPGNAPVDYKYPGGPYQNIGYPDVEKACWSVGRARVTCDFDSVAYMTLPNDHTQGVGTGTPAPEVMFAVNDEATGLFIDGLSHSPLWASSLVIVTEDDPAQGGDHIDYHRTVFVVASPWVKRGYVTHTQTSIPAIHKLIAHIFAIPYSNEDVADAALPLDVFTSTPDYTPYDYVHRTLPLHCGEGATKAEQRLTSSWDMHDVDEQPGLEAQVGRWLRGEQYTELPPALEAEVARREEAQRLRLGGPRTPQAPRGSSAQGADVDDDDR